MKLDQDEQELEYYCQTHQRFSATPLSTQMPLERIKEKANEEHQPISCHSTFARSYLPPHQQRLFSFTSSNWAHALSSFESKGPTLNLFQSTSALEALMPERKQALHLVIIASKMKPIKQAL